MDCQYVATQRGGVALVFEGHRYNKVRDGKDGTVYWRCSRDRQCPGRAVTVHSRIKKANNKHNHSPDNGTIGSKAVLNNLPSLTSSTPSRNSIQNQATNVFLNAFENAAAATVDLLRNGHQQTLNNNFSNQNSNQTTKQINENSVNAAMAAFLSQNTNKNSTAAATFESFLQQHHTQPIFSTQNLNSCNPVKANNLASLQNGTSPDLFSKSNPLIYDNSNALSKTRLNNYISNSAYSSNSCSPLNNVPNVNMGNMNINSLTSKTNTIFHNSTKFCSDYFLNENSKLSANLLNASLLNENINKTKTCNSSNTINSVNNLDQTNNQIKQPMKNQLNQYYNLLSNHKSSSLNDLNSFDSLFSSASSTTNPNSNLNQISSNNLYDNTNSSNICQTDQFLNSDWLSRLMSTMNKTQLSEFLAQLNIDRLTISNHELNVTNNVNVLKKPSESTLSTSNNSLFSNNSSSLSAHPHQNTNHLSYPNISIHETDKKNEEDKTYKTRYKYHQITHNSQIKNDEYSFENKFNGNKFKKRLDGTKQLMNLDKTIVEDLLDTKDELNVQNLNDKNYHKFTKYKKYKSNLLTKLYIDEEEHEDEEESIDKSFRQFDLPDSNSSTTLNLIKLTRLIGNQNLICETLNQLYLTNPQMASALTISILNQLDFNLNQTTSKQNKSFHGKHVLSSPTDNLKNKLSKTSSSVDYYTDSSDEDQPLNMAVRNSTNLVRKLRQLMKNLNHVPEPLQAYIIPSSDDHLSEYVGDCDKRRQYLTNFSGSTGTAIVTTEEHLLWVDGRYFIQAENELYEGWKLVKEINQKSLTITDYLTKNLSNGSKVGIDAKLISYNKFFKLNKKLNNNGIEIIPLMENLVDLIWPDKPERLSQPIEPLDRQFTALSWEEKVQQVRVKMQEKEAAILVLSTLDDIAWLFNLRGSDIKFNPLFYAYSVITLDSIYLFIQQDQLSANARKHLNLERLENNNDSMIDSPSSNQDTNMQSEDLKIQLRSYGSIFESLKEIHNINIGKVWISSESNYALVNLIPESQRIDSINPVVLMKAVKNPTEIQCMRNAHIKDAVALCEYFAWLEEEISKGNVTEISASDKLYEFRKEQLDFIQNSFETISCSGPNSSIIHYKPTESTNRVLNVNEIYLVDSGGQYLDGTTDITRTLHFGTPTSFERQMFTRVLKGHICLANCIFPSGTKGHCLDTLARKSLWEVGQDYLHGTGHGVGCYLNVHEGPIHIGYHPSPNDPGLTEGMILSNEPGFYEDNKFGIRIENLVVVQKKDTKYNFNDKGYMCFDTISLVPIQTKLLEPSLLTIDEIEWLDNYHQKCREIVGNALKEQGRTAGYKWLIKETQPLG